MQRVYEQRKVKHATCKKVNGGVWGSKRNWRHILFGVVPIGGAIVHPRWWRLQPTKGNSCASPRRAPPTKGPRRSNHVYPTMAIDRPRRTCLTRVDLHEVGDLLARTNPLVQLQNLVGGSQVTPNQSRRHHSPKGNGCCFWWWLLALVLQKIVSPTLNSLS